MTATNLGRPIWYELLTTDPRGAIAFYTELAGWKTLAWDKGDYTLWLTSQGPLGGVTVLPDAAKQLGTAPYWLASLKVENVDETLATVQQLGGRVLMTGDVPNVGRFSVIADPQGALISLFAPARDMPVHDPARPGEFSWHELHTTDHAAAFTFYQRIAGWDRVDEVDMGPGGRYLLWSAGGTQLGGMMTRPDQAEPPAWRFYLTTDDLEAALARATAAGARVVAGATAVPGGQRIAQLLDPQGAAFALVTPAAR